MSFDQTNNQNKWTAAELRRLPPEQRDAILEAAAALAEQEYRSNPELTAFEAFGEDDLPGDSAAVLARPSRAQRQH
jgi:acyl-CoA reductase-like NAD-dependent aldehyde dehydrogenase